MYGANSFTITSYPDSNSECPIIDVPMVVTACKNKGDEHYPTKDGDVWTEHWLPRKRFSNESPMRIVPKDLKVAVANAPEKTDPRNNRVVPDLRSPASPAGNGVNPGSDVITFQSYVEGTPISFRVEPKDPRILPFIMRVSRATTFTDTTTGLTKSIITEPTGKHRFINPGDFASAELFTTRGRGRGLRR